LSWAALNARNILALFLRAIVLAELVVDSCQQEMGLTVFGVEFCRSRQLRTRFLEASKFDQRLAREKMSIRRIRLQRLSPLGATQALLETCGIMPEQQQYAQVNQRGIMAVIGSLTGVDRLR